MASRGGPEERPGERWSDFRVRQQEWYADMERRRATLRPRYDELRARVRPGMTRDDLLSFLALLKDPGFEDESDHVDADEALIAYINDPAITDAYDWHKFYA